MKKVVFIQWGRKRSWQVFEECVDKVEMVDGSMFLWSRLCENHVIDNFFNHPGSGLSLILENGDEVCLDSHRIWILKSEWNELFDKGTPDEVAWCFGVQPEFPSK